MSKQARLALQPPDAAVTQTWTPDDIYDRASEEIIRGFNEDHRVERKPARFDPRQLGDYFSIFANRLPSCAEQHKHYRGRKGAWSWVEDCEKTLDGLEKAKVCVRRNASSKLRDPKARYFLVGT